MYECGECWPVVRVEGFEAMVHHIKAKHPNYVGKEIEEYAIAWQVEEEPYSPADQADDYNDERMLEKSIDADREFQTHKI